MIAPPVSLRTDEQIVSYYRLASEAIGQSCGFNIVEKSDEWGQGDILDEQSRKAFW